MYKKLRHPERPFVLHIFIGCDPPGIARKLNLHKKKKSKIPPDYFIQDENDTAITHDLVDYLPGHFAIILYPGYTAEDIAHEAVHATARHFRYIGQPLTIDSEESYAYMVGWITKVITNLKSI